MCVAVSAVSWPGTSEWAGSAHWRGAALPQLGQVAQRLRDRSAQLVVREAQTRRVAKLPTRPGSSAKLILPEAQYIEIADCPTRPGSLRQLVMPEDHLLQAGQVTQLRGIEPLSSFS